MLALGWIFCATLLLSIQNASALPTANDNTVQVERLHTDVVIDGQLPPPCVHGICPQSTAGVRAVVPGHNSTSNLTSSETKHYTDHTVPSNHTGKSKPHHTGANDTTHVSDGHGTEVSGGHIRPSEPYSDVPTACSTSDDESKLDASHLAKPDHELVSNSSHPHLAKPEHLRSAYRIVGQPPPACHNRICPLTQTRRDEVTEDSESKLAQPKHFRAAYKVSGNETVPASCRNGKVRCLSHSSRSSPDSHAANRKALIAGGDERDPTTEYHPVHRKTACPPSDKPNHSSNATAHHFPGTHQTAPVTCGDGRKPPCGDQHHIADHGHGSGNSSNGTTHFPGTHQTAPITCGDGRKPPCGDQHALAELAQQSGNSSKENTRFPGTHQTAPITCGDGRKPPCT